jgi:hypothetical protein
MMTGTKDVMHRCGNCGAVLAKWFRNSGAVQVLAHPVINAQQQGPGPEVRMQEFQ